MDRFDRPDWKGDIPTRNMNKTTPNIEPLTHLRILISAEEERTNQIASHVRISYRLANGLMGMTADDWYAARKGFSDLATCERLAAAFVRDGKVAANGLPLSNLGPVIEVADDLGAPDVEII